MRLLSWLAASPSTQQSDSCRASLDGLNVWLKVAQDSGLSDIALARTMAQGFAGHPSFDSIYGHLNDAQFIDAIYTTIGGAPADVSGKQFWLNQLQNPNPLERLSKADFVGEFLFVLLNITRAELDTILIAGSISQEEYDNAVLRQDRLTNKSEVGLKFIQALGAAANMAAGTNPLDPASLANDPAYRASKAIVAGVTHDDATKTNPLQYLDSAPTVEGILGRFEQADSAPRAPWTLLMATSSNVGAKILISDGSAAGTDVKAVGDSFVYSYLKWMVNSDKTGAYFFNQTSGWSDYTGSGSAADTVGYTDGTLAGTQSIITNQYVPTSFVSLVSNQLILAGASQDRSSGKAYVIDVLQKKSTSTDIDFPVPSTDIFQNTIHDATHQVLWFGARSSPYGYELVRFDYSNPTQMPSTLVKDIYPGAVGALGSNYWDTLDAAVLPNGKLIFGANDGTNGQEAWVSDGTEAGTFMLKNYGQGIYGDVGGFRPYGNKTVFSAWAYNVGSNGEISDTGIELAFTDGTSIGTTLLDINPGPANSRPSIVGEANGLLYFTADVSDQTSSNTQKGIYSTNGTTFSKLATINSGATLLGWNVNKAFFKVSDAQHGDELWAADFDKNTFGLLKDILPGSGAGLGDTDANNVQMAAGKLIFKAHTSATKQGLFVSDGTAAGTVSVGTVNMGSGTNSYSKVVGDTLVFNNAEGVFAVNLSVAIPQAVPLSAVGLLNSTFNFNSAALQTDADQAFYLTNGGDLFASQGTTVPTTPLASQVKQFKVVAENALFIQTTNTATNTQSLWYSDGTAAGTRFIEDLPSGDFDLQNAVAIKTVGVIA